MSRRSAHRGHTDNPASDRQGNTPCESCSAVWAHFIETGDTDGHRFHASCTQVLCGPRLHEPEATMVRRKVPRLLPIGSKGWWEL